jgi:sarcosine oxidase
VTVTTTERRTWDAIVVGLGGIGAAAACWLAERLGEGVLGLEQFPFGANRGASQDHSRIIRLSYHRPEYVRLARRAYATWAEVEDRAGARIVTRTGGLDLFPPGARIPEADYAASMTAEGVAFERLDAAEAMRRWPAWRLEAGTVVLHQAESGIADPFRGNAAHLDLARAAGATLLDRTAVVRLADDAGDLTVETADGARHRTGRVILAADAWTNRLLADLGLRLPLVTTKEQVTYFAPRDGSPFAPGRFPIWIWMDDPSFYGFPTYGEPGPKAARDCGGPEVELDDPIDAPDPGAAACLRDFLARHLPGMVDGGELLTRTCRYTLTPDRDFVVDRVPDHPGVHVALGAAHGFKFASVIGRILAELAVDGQTPSAPELDGFRIDRSVLREADPVRRWLI